MERNQQAVASFRLDSPTNPPRSADGGFERTGDDMMIVLKDTQEFTQDVIGGGDEEGHARTSGVPSSQHLREAKISNASVFAKSVHGMNSKKYSEERVFAPVRMLQVGVRTSSMRKRDGGPAALPQDHASLETKDLGSPSLPQGAVSTQSGRASFAPDQQLSLDPDVVTAVDEDRTGKGLFDTGFYSPHKQQSASQNASQRTKPDKSIEKLLKETAVERETWRARRGWQGSPMNNRGANLAKTAVDWQKAQAQNATQTQPKHMIIISQMTQGPQSQAQSGAVSQDGQGLGRPTQLYDFSIIEQPKNAPESGPGSTLHQIKMLNKHNLDARELRYKQAKFKGRMRSQHRHVGMPPFGAGGFTLTASEERFNVMPQSQEDAKSSFMSGWPDGAQPRAPATGSGWRPAPHVRTGPPRSISSGQDAPFSATGVTRGSTQAAGGTIVSSHAAANGVDDAISAKQIWPGGVPVQDSSPEHAHGVDRAISIRSYLAAQRQATVSLQPPGEPITPPHDAQSRAITRIVQADSPEVDQGLAPLPKIENKISQLRTDPSFAAGTDAEQQDRNLGLGSAHQTLNSQHVRGNIVPSRVTEEKSAKTEESSGETIVAKNASLARGTDYFASGARIDDVNSSTEHAVRAVLGKRDMPSVPGGETAAFVDYPLQDLRQSHEQQRTGLSTAGEGKRSTLKQQTELETMPSGSAFTSGAPPGGASLLNQTLPEKRPIITPAAGATRAKANSQINATMMNQAKSQVLDGARPIPQKQDLDQSSMSKFGYTHHAWNWSQKIEQMSNSKRQEEMRSIIKQQFEYQPSMLTAGSANTRVPGSSNIIIDEDKQRRLFDQLGIPIDLSNKKRIESIQRESKLGQKIIDSRLLQFELEEKRGMSVFHQSTFTNMFEKEAMNPQFPNREDSNLYLNNESLLALQGARRPISQGPALGAGNVYSPQIIGGQQHIDPRQMIIRDMDKLDQQNYQSEMHDPSGSHEPGSGATSLERMDQELSRKVTEACDHVGHYPQSFEKHANASQMVSAVIAEHEKLIDYRHDVPNQDATSREALMQFDSYFAQRPVLSKQRSAKELSYFRREVNDASAKALSKERKQLEQQYVRVREKRVEARSHQRMLHQLQKQNAKGADGVDNSLQLPSLLEQNVSQRTKYMTVSDRVADPKILTAAANVAVSNQMLDVDDLLTNNQFHSRALKTESLQRKYEDLRKKARRINQIKQDRAAQSYVDIYVKHASQLPEQQARYAFKHNLDCHPKIKKLENLRAAKTQQKVQPSPKSTMGLNEGKARGRRKMPKPLATKQPDELDLPLSRCSSFERRQKAHDSYFEYHHDYTENAERYFIKLKEVDWRNKREQEQKSRLDHERTIQRLGKYATKTGKDPEETEPSTIELQDLESNVDIYQLIEKLDQNIENKRDKPGKIQTDGLNAYKIKQAAKSLFKLLYWPVVEEKVYKPGEVVLPVSPRERKLEEQRDLEIEHDDRFKTIILNVFKFFSSDPLKNEKVVCGVKNGLHAVKNFLDYDRSRDLPTSDDKRICCEHKFADDSEIETRYKIQLWHIHFCKYIAMHLLNLSIQHDNIALGQLEPEDQDPDVVEGVHQKTLTSRAMKKQLADAGSKLKGDARRKLDRSAQVKRELLKQMIEIAATFTPEEHKLFASVEQIIETLNDPLLKLVAVRLPGAILKVSDLQLDIMASKAAEAKRRLHVNYEKADLRDVGMSPSQRVIAYQGEGRQLFEFAEQQELLINKMTSQVLHKFRREVKNVTRARNVTFKNMNEHHDSIFTYEETAALKLNLSKMDLSTTVRQMGLGAGHSREHSIAGTSTHNQLREDDSAINQASIESGSKIGQSFGTSRPSARPDMMTVTAHSPIQELPSLRLDRNATELTDRKFTVNDKRKPSPAPQALPPREHYTGPLQPKDLVKSLFNIMNDKYTNELVAAYNEKLKKQDEDDEEARAFKEIRKKVLKKQSSSLSIKSPKEGAPESTTELARALPLDLKSQLYKYFKYTSEKTNTQLNPRESVKFEFYSKAKQLMQGTYDNFDSYQVEYFKCLGSQQILPMPLLFKHMDDNFIYLKSIKVNIEQAIAIQETLKQAAQTKSKMEECPFLIKTLVIDDCGMTDEVFAEILKGICAQNCIRSIHYTNGNTIGMKSAKLLVELCSRMGSSQFIKELNLSNVRFLYNTAPGELQLLAQITQAVESVQKASRLKFVDIDMSDPEVQQNIFDILNSMGFVLRHVNLSNCRISPQGMANISRAFQLCDKLDSLNISWNVVCRNTEVVDKAASKQLKAQADERERLVQEIVDNICALIALPTCQLRHLDIAGMGFRREHYRCIFKAVQKNTRLQSINFGQIDDEQTLRYLTDMLQLESSHMIRKEGRIGLPTYACPEGLRFKGKIEHGLSFKGFYLNAQLLKRNKRDSLIARSMLVEHSALHSANKRSMLQLNRLCWHPELVFNPVAPFGKADPHFPRRWIAVPECSYTERHCYVAAFYNQAKPELNDFQMLTGQDEFIRHIEKQIRAAQADDAANRPLDQQGVKAPVIVANGQIFQMISAVGYACLLALGELNALKKQHLAMQPYGAVEVTQIFKENSGGSSLDPTRRAEQEAYNQLLTDMDDAATAQAICEVAQESLTSYDFEYMSEAQQRISAQFESFNWEKVIDDKLCNAENDPNRLIINRQSFRYCGGMQAQYDAIKLAQKMASSKSRNSTTRQKEDDSSVTATNLHGSQASVSQVARTERIVSYAPTVFAFAGFLPPGRNEIFVYDRHNKRVLYKELLVDMTGADVGRRGGDWTTNLQRNYTPEPKPSLEVERIDRKYEEDLEDEARAAQGLPPLEREAIHHDAEHAEGA